MLERGEVTDKMLTLALGSEEMDILDIWILATRFLFIDTYQIILDMQYYLHDAYYLQHVPNTCNMTLYTIIHECLGA